MRLFYDLIPIQTVTRSGTSGGCGLPLLFVFTTPLHSAPLCLGSQTQLTAVGGHVAPPGHQAVLISRGAARGQGHSLHVAVEGGRAAQLDQHDVVVQVVAVVLRVLDHLGTVNPLLGALIDSDVVLAKTDLDTTGGDSYKSWRI